MSVERRIAPRRADVLRVLAEHRDELAALGITSLALFGSVARDDAGPNSDVDLLVELDPARHIGLFGLAEANARVRQLLGVGVDLVTRGSLKPQLRDRVLDDAVPVLAIAPRGGLEVVTPSAAELHAADDLRREVPMPPRNWMMRVDDMLAAAAAIAEYTAGLDFDGFCADRLRVDATLRNLEVIGEAARYVPADVRARYPQVPWQPMADMRNVVIHAYPDVDLQVVWDVIRRQLPALVPVWQEILAGEAGA